MATRPEVHREKKSLRKKLLQALYGDDVHYVVNGDVSYNSAQKARIDAERLAALREARGRHRPRKESNLSMDSASETLESVLDAAGDELVLDIESLSSTSSLSDHEERRRSRRSTMRRSLSTAFSFVTHKQPVTSDRKKPAKSTVLAAKLKTAATTIKAPVDINCSVRDGGHRFDLLVLERASAGKRRPTGLEVAAADEPFVFASQTYEGSLIVLGCKLALAVPTVQQAWASSGVRAGDRIVAVNGTAGPAEKLLSLLRRDNKKRRLTLVRPQAEEGLGWRDSVRARRKLFV